MSSYPLCQWCQSPNPPRSRACSQCGAPIQPPAPPPPVPPAPFRPDYSLPSWAKLFLIITSALIVWFFGMAAVRLFSPESFEKPPTVNFNAARSSPAPVVSLAPAASPTPASPVTTNAERLAVAKRFMNGGNLHDLDNAEEHLKNIQRGTPEYKEARSLLKKLAAQRAALLRDELKTGGK